jgi:hypothetical protein
MAEKKQLSRMVILKNFFGYKQGQGLKDFTAEIKALSSGEMTELATLAAIELSTDEMIIEVAPPKGV